MTGKMANGDDIKPGVPDEIGRAMLEVILSFAWLDTALSALLVQSYGMALDRGALLVENMDIGNKIERLRKIHAHDKNVDAVKAFAQLKKAYERHRAARNTIAHATYAGTSKSRPNTAIFSPVRTGDAAGLLQVVFIPIAHMRLCARWADDSARTLIAVFEQNEGRVERLAE